jgi:hypothetical protein
MYAVIFHEFYLSCIGTFPIDPDESFKLSIMPSCVLFGSSADWHGVTRSNLVNLINMVPWVSHWKRIRNQTIWVYIFLFSSISNCKEQEFSFELFLQGYEQKWSKLPCWTFLIDETFSVFCPDQATSCSEWISDLREFEAVCLCCCRTCMHRDQYTEQMVDES